MLKYMMIDDATSMNQFISMMGVYLRELEDDMKITDEIVQKYSTSLVNKSSPLRINELLLKDEKPIGFFALKIDQEGDKGYTRVGECYIMELYIDQLDRRKGYGSAMFSHICNMMRDKGVSHIYLTSLLSDSTTFWIKQGFTITSEICPDNDLPILLYEIHRSI